MSAGILIKNDGSGNLGGAFRNGPVTRDGYDWQDYDVDAIPNDIDVCVWDGEKVVESSALKDEQRKQEILQELEAIDAQYHSDRSWREYVLANSNQFDDKAVNRMQNAEDRAETLRQEYRKL